MDVLDKNNGIRRWHETDRKIQKQKLFYERRCGIWGVRYRKNYGKVTGTPDIAITKCKIAILWMEIFGMQKILRN